MKRNPYLRVKIKTLATEAKHIRSEEIIALKEGNYSLLNSLHNHRTHIVRREARATLLAYQYLRGFPYTIVEPEPKSNPFWDAVHRIVHKYGGGNFDHKKWIEGKNFVKSVTKIPEAPQQAA